MIKHIVMWRLKPSAEGGSRNENLAKLKALLEGLPRQIPQIRALEVGLNFNDAPAAYDVVLYTEFATRADLAAYQSHPEHLRVADFVAKVRSERVVADYESP